MSGGRAVALTISRAEARRLMLGQAGLLSMRPEAGREGVRSMLSALRCVQLDPLDPMGTNADLVAMARVEGVGRGDIHRHAHPGAFEHFAKERCLLPGSAFPYYRDKIAMTPWWRLGERLKRLSQGLIDEVLAEVEARGPVEAGALEDRGQVRPLDWSGWKGTSKAASMAVEVLWTRCQIVVCGRSEGGRKLYDVPRRALPEVFDAPGGDFDRWALLERVEAAGMLSRASGPHWSMLSEVRTGPLVGELIEEGRIEEVEVEGSRRPYLIPAGALSRPFGEPDERLRILGPLDPLIWDRGLVEQAFGFEYLWEVYKPAQKRRWGWYVCPLLHRGAFVGRIEARIKEGELAVERLWVEAGAELDLGELNRALERHAAACGVGSRPVGGPTG